VWERRSVVIFLIFYLLKPNKAEQLKKSLPRSGSSVFGSPPASRTKPDKAEHQKPRRPDHGQNEGWREMAVSAQAQVRLPWHPPMIFETIDHVIVPRAAQLVISSRHPKREHTDHERDAQLNREAVNAWRERQYDKQHKNKINPRACYTVEGDGDLLNMLVGMGQILDSETGDPKIVGEAISDMLAEAAQDWKAKH
jgi:hypothetical protein